MLKGFGAVPPLVTDIDLSMDNRFLYVSCWGTGDLRQYGVSDPFAPKLTGTVRIGGIVSRAAHPKAGGKLNGGPQMVEISRDGKQVYFTNSLYGAIDEQFHHEELDGWMVKLDAKPGGGIAFDPDFFTEWPKTHRPHQIRLEGGDCSSDSYCYPWGPAPGSSTMADGSAWPWLTFAGLGVFHGLNPAMGWLFAVALGLHKGSRRAVLLALPPMAAGHALSIWLVAASVLAMGTTVDGGPCASPRAGFCCSGRGITGAMATTIRCGSA